MTSLGEKIIARIKNDKIQPTPRWKFALHELFLRIVFAISVLIGSVAVSVMLTLILSDDWSVYRQANITMIQIYLLSIPYLWIGILTIFIGLAYYNWRHTKLGYRYRVAAVLGGSIVLSLALGSILYAAGLGEKIDQSLDRNIPAYGQMMFNRNLMWTQPERGLISGEIIEIYSEESFEIKDSNKKNWKISGEDITWRGQASANIGEKIKIIGEQKGKNEFSAEEVRPWSGRGMMGGNRGKMMR